MCKTCSRLATTALNKCIMQTSPQHAGFRNIIFRSLSSCTSACITHLLKTDVAGRQPAACLKHMWDLSCDICISCGLKQVRFPHTLNYQKCSRSPLIHVRAAADAGHNLPPLFAGTELTTPACALAESNATTIHNKWQQWAVVQADGPGSKISSTSNLKEAYDSVKWKTIVMTKDNLVVNDCITVDRRHQPSQLTFE